MSAAARPGEPALRARGLVKRFGRVTALDGVDLDLFPGRVLALLGPNGAGKSTLLRILAGLVRPSGGSLAIQGEERDRRRARSRIGYLGHATLLYPELTARENLLFAARLYRVPEREARVQALLEAHALGDVADRPSGGFSRGMAQRLAIARSLVHDPAVLLLDEPYTGLDRAACARLSARVRSLRDEGRAVLLVSHDPALAAELGDSVLLLRRGAVSERLEGGCDAGRLAALLDPQSGERG